MKKILLLGCVSLAAVALMSSAAMADVYYTAKVNKATAKPNGVTAIQLVKPAGTTCCTTTNCWYSAPTGADDQTLAVALTAISLGSNVRVGLVSDSSCVITEMGIENPN